MMNSLEGPKDSKSVADIFSPEINDQYLELEDLFLQQYLAAKEKGQQMDLYKRRTDFAKKLQNIYPDALEYLFFHVLIGSTPKLDDIKYVDFPNPADSVESFIQNNP